MPFFEFLPQGIFRRILFIKKAACEAASTYQMSFWNPTFGAGVPEFAAGIAGI